jgi:hypothetical protein
LIEADPDEVNARDYILSTPPWWDDLDEFTKSYIEAALWSTNDESDQSGGEPLDKNYGRENIAPETLKAMAQDCLRFQQENAEDLAQYDLGHSEWSAAEQGGHDFWLSRNGHGAGFFDRDSLPEDVRDRLQDVARRWGEVNLYVGDDGLIH